jgi:hypothetical protein
MSDAAIIPNEAETRARFIIASAARQSSAACDRSGLPRCFASRNESRLALLNLYSKGIT